MAGNYSDPQRLSHRLIIQLFIQEDTLLNQQFDSFAPHLSATASGALRLPSATVQYRSY